MTHTLTVRCLSSRPQAQQQWLHGLRQQSASAEPPRPRLALILVAVDVRIRVSCVATWPRSLFSWRALSWPFALCPCPAFPPRAPALPQNALLSLSSAAWLNVTVCITGLQEERYNATASLQSPIGGPGAGPRRGSAPLIEPPQASPDIDAIEPSRLMVLPSQAADGVCCVISQASSPPADGSGSVTRGSSSRARPAGSSASSGSGSLSKRSKGSKRRGKQQQPQHYDYGYQQVGVPVLLRRLSASARPFARMAGRNVH
jgi:hypothetical protein